MVCFLTVNKLKAIKTGLVVNEKVMDIVRIVRTIGIPLVVFVIKLILKKNRGRANLGLGPWAAVEPPMGKEVFK